MCKSPLHPLLQKLPKCEHHNHVEGCMTPELLFELSAKNNIPLPDPSSDPAFTSPATLHARYDEFTSLSDFLTYYFIGMSVLRTESDFSALATAYFTAAHASNVQHAEIFFDPQAHTARGISYSTVRAGLQQACDQAKQNLGITSLLIPCFLRNLPPAHANEVFTSAVLPDLRAGHVAGIGLSSNELGNPPGLFTEIFAAAAQEGFRRTSHAGEEAPAAYAQEALDKLSVQRIDHGIRVAEDEALMKRVADSKTLLTVCPISNVKLQCVQSVAEVPIRTFLENKVHFSINGDDPAYFGAYIGECYCAVQDAFGLDVADWEWICRGAIQGSWCDDKRKAELEKLLDEVLTQWSRGNSA